MGFDINKFAAEFQKTIDLILTENRTIIDKQVVQWIRYFIDNKNELSINPDSHDALKFLIGLIVTNAWYYKEREGFDIELNTIIANNMNFRLPATQAELTDLVGNFAPGKINIRAREKMQKLLTAYPTLKQFTEKQYNLAKRGETEVLGEKGRDNYLRDFGYWDRIPMDRHEMRFLIRTGVYHACSVEGNNDPLKKASMHEALTKFCSNHLKGKMIEGIDLGDSPGIVDLFIWIYCGKGEGKYNVCGSSPKCNECKLNSACLYALENSRQFKQQPHTSSNV